MRMGEQEMERLAEKIARMIRPPLTLTTQQVAEELHCSRQFVGVLRKQGKIRGIKHGNQYVYPYKSVKLYAESFGTTKNA